MFWTIITLMAWYFVGVDRKRSIVQQIIDSLYIYNILTNLIIKNHIIQINQFDLFLIENNYIFVRKFKKIVFLKILLKNVSYNNYYTY